MDICGWGRTLRVDADVSIPLSNTQCTQALIKTESLIARGLGRSYGDSSLACHVLDTHLLDHFIAFDDTTGLLTCAAGVSLDDILHVFVARGWFLPITPGTRFITMGGAIASDVHGKNHHMDGTFTDHVTQIELLLGNGERVFASREENTDLFHATCGGMGLTGIILSASLRLKSIHSSDIIATTIKTPDLDAVLAAFSEHANSTYSVAWIDCLARGKSLGRSLLMLGDHADHGPLIDHFAKKNSIPFDMPSCLLNQVTAKAFNALYYRASLQTNHTQRMHFDSFFYPLDSLGNWNRLYGKQGFVQYQFVLPLVAGVAGLRDVLEHIAASGRASFLAVLKRFGKANQNHLSFPMEGYTLALDFKAEPAVFELLNELDKRVFNHGGRLYLAKDARMSEAGFKASYLRWQEFEAVRAKYDAMGKFVSMQSQRLGFK